MARWCYVGNLTTAGVWCLIGTASGTVAGIHVPSLAAFPSSIYLPPGNYGVPRNTVVSPPRLGQTMASTYTHLAQNVVFALVGFSRTTSGFGALPFDMTGLGAPGCFARVSGDAIVLLVGSGGLANFGMSIPASTAYLGAQLYTQGLSLDAANALGAVMSDANGAILGM